MNKIAVISPYFGELPKNINLTINSMLNNSFIDWYIITDNHMISSYKNVNVIYKTFDEIKKLIKRKLHTEIFNPYKLCDYKPTYGFLFDEMLSNYKIWGYCDLDIIFGNLSKFLTADKMNTYDKIYDLGHFSLMRNTKNISEAFKKAKPISYKTILNDNAIFVFDETYDANHKGINGILEELNYKVYDKRDEFADISIKHSNFYINNFPKKNGYYFEYDNGNLYLMASSDKDFKQEMAYVHLQKRTNIPILTKSSVNYIIVPKGVIDVTYVNSQYFFKINWKIIWYIKFRIRRKMENKKTQKKLNYKF